MDFSKGDWKIEFDFDYPMSDWEIRIDGISSWATFETELLINKVTVKTRESRVLEKENGLWKLVQHTAYFTVPIKVPNNFIKDSLWIRMKPKK